MNLAAKITIGVSALVVAGLVALAAPVVLQVGSTVAALTAESPLTLAAGQPAAEVTTTETAPAEAQPERALPAVAETTPVSMDEYMASLSSEGYTDIVGVHDEYRRAVAIFPLPLPEGYAFPAESREKEDETGMRFTLGTGEVEAYTYWASATTRAAYDAHISGDTATANRHLDALEAGYDSPVGRASIDDPDRGFINDGVNPAREGNYRVLQEAYLLSFRK